MGWGIWFYDAKTSNRVDEVLKSSKDNLNNKTIKRTISSPFDLFYENVLKAVEKAGYPVRIIVTRMQDELPPPLRPRSLSAPH